VCRRARASSETIIAGNEKAKQWGIADFAELFTETEINRKNAISV
jgi:hypothetical protein